MYDYTALVTCLAVLFYFVTSARVARARIKYGVKLPAISGNEDFERVFRVQMNTLEWLPIFLPSLWLFAAYHSDAVAQSVPRRSPGFFIQALAVAVLLFGSIIAIVWRMMHA